MQESNNQNEVYTELPFYKIMMIHWRLNPGLVINELLLGQRVPAKAYQANNMQQTWSERSRIQCPHCDTMHHSYTWSIVNKTQFGNWFGLYCPHCEGIIPCVWNWTSLLVLALTSPLWYPFKDKLKEKWMAAQKKKFSKELIFEKSAHQVSWWKSGLMFGGLMFLFNGVLFRLAEDTPITFQKLAIQIVVWILAGLGFGITMKALEGYKGNLSGKKYVPKKKDVSAP